MWEIVVVVLIVGMGLYLTGRSMMRARIRDGTGGCAGCSGRTVCGVTPDRNGDQRAEGT